MPGLGFASASEKLLASRAGRPWPARTLSDAKVLC
jgi:hypothetical protein